MSSSLVAVTGATGFLGRRLTGRLSARGWRVRILVRDGSRAKGLDYIAPDVVMGDLGDADALTDLVAGADWVINAAGLTKARDRAAFFDVNGAGARRLAQASEGRPLIHVSSQAAREPRLSDYAASKRAGEEAVRDVAGLAAVIVRPPIIYGPGDRETLALFKMARGPIMIAPTAAAARVAVAYVDDVADVIADLLIAPSVHETITIGGDRPSGRSWRDIYSAAAQAVGGHPTIVSAPRELLIAAGAALQRLGQWRKDPPMFTVGKAREACHSDWSVSVIEQGVTVDRRYTTLVDGFARTVAWYRTQGWLP